MTINLRSALSADTFPVKGGLVSILPKLSDRCLLCPEGAERGLYCAPCRRKIDTIGGVVGRQLIALIDGTVSLWGENVDARRIAPALVEPMRAVALIRNLRLLEIAIAAGAPEPIVDKLMRNLLAIRNPRTLDEVKLLLPNQESPMVLMYAGFYEASVRALPRVRHLRALKRHFPTPLTKETAKDLVEIMKSWSLHESSEHWRNKVLKMLSFAERPALRRALLAGSGVEGVQAVLNSYIDGAVVLGLEADEIKPEESLDAYLKRLVSRQAKATREELPHFQGRGRVVSGDSPAFRDGDESIWDTTPAPADDDGVEASLDQLVATAGLTPRQSQVLRLRVAGYGQSEIAARLGVSQPRVSQLLQEVMRKVSATLAE